MRSIEDVRAAVAEEDVAAVSACCIHIRSADKSQALDAGIVGMRSSFSPIHLQDVVAGATGRQNRLAEIADQGVVPGAAKNRDYVALDGDGVVQIVAGPRRTVCIDVEIFDICTENDAGNLGPDRIDALVGRLDDDILQGVNDIGVVAGTADQSVGAEPTIQRVVAGLARKRVCLAVALEDIGEFVARTSQRFVFEREVVDIGGQHGTGNQGDDGIVALVGRLFDDDVAQVIDDTGIAAPKAGHDVAAIEASAPEPPSRKSSPGPP